MSPANLLLRATPFAAVFILLLLTACAGQQEPAPEQDAQQAQLDALSQQLDRIERRLSEAESREKTRQEAAVAAQSANAPGQPRNTAGNKTPTPTTRATAPPTKAAATPTPYPTRATAPTPRPDSPSICGRSPLVQQEILEQLQIPSCQVINNQELYRILELELGHPEHPLKPGDMDGLVNLTELDIRTNYLPAGIFKDLANLQHLNIELDVQGTIEPGAFTGLSGLETLSLRYSNPSSVAGNEIDFRPIPAFDAMPNLEGMNLEIPDLAPAFNSDQFSNLPDLKWLVIGAECCRESVYQLAPGLFGNNHQLMSIELSGFRKLEGPTDLFQRLERLENLEISHSGGDDMDPEFALHPRSPLMKAIINQNTQPYGFTVILPDSG